MPRRLPVVAGFVAVVTAVFLLSRPAELAGCLQMVTTTNSSKRRNIPIQRLTQNSERQV